MLTTVVSGNLSTTPLKVVYHIWYLFIIFTISVSNRVAEQEMSKKNNNNPPRTHDDITPAGLCVPSHSPLVVLLVHQAGFLQQVLLHIRSADHQIHTLERLCLDEILDERRARLTLWRCHSPGSWPGWTSQSDWSCCCEPSWHSQKPEKTITNINNTPFTQLRESMLRSWRYYCLYRHAAAVKHQ